MSILIDATTRVLVQGITGREGAARTRLMLDYGTRVIGGVTPGRGGQTVCGVPVFNTVAEVGPEFGPIDISVIFVPAPQVKSAAMEAIAAGVKLVALIADRVPLFDVLEIVETGARFIGPNLIGIVSPEQALIGMIGGSAATAKSWFRAGDIGIVSRSGGLGVAAAYYVCRGGFGVSTMVHVGGDAIVGMTLADIVLRFEADPGTRVIVVIGEIGTSQEEQVAGLLRSGEVTKPVVAYVGGKSAVAGTRYSHAGAIIQSEQEGGHGAWAGKVDTLREAGAIVVESFGQICGIIPDRS
jgi:succinyl-CoA synthetase alpha subunit